MKIKDTRQRKEELKWKWKTKQTNEVEEQII